MNPWASLSRPYDYDLIVVDNNLRGFSLHGPVLLSKFCYFFAHVGFCNVSESGHQGFWRSDTVTKIFAGGKCHASQQLRSSAPT